MIYDTILDTIGKTPVVKVNKVANHLITYNENFENFLIDEFLVNQTIMQSKFMEKVF